MDEARPIHEVFLPVAQGIAFLTRGRGIYRFQTIKRDEPFKAFSYPQDDGTTRLVYQRVNEPRRRCRAARRGRRYRSRHLWRRAYSEV